MRVRIQVGRIARVTHLSCSKEERMRLSGVGGGGTPCIQRSGTRTAQVWWRLLRSHWLPNPYNQTRKKCKILQDSLSLRGQNYYSRRPYTPAPWEAAAAGGVAAMVEGDWAVTRVRVAETTAVSKVKPPRAKMQATGKTKQAMPILAKRNCTPTDTTHGGRPQVGATRELIRPKLGLEVSTANVTKMCPIKSASKLVICRSLKPHFAHAP